MLSILHLLELPQGSTTPLLLVSVHRVSGYDPLLPRDGEMQKTENSALVATHSLRAAPQERTHRSSNRILAGPMTGATGA